MKKLVYSLMLVALLVFAGCEKEWRLLPDVTDTTDTTDEPYTEPSGDGLFSVSEGKQVRFASGNLEYDSINGYYFAAHQYDYGGYFCWGTGSNPTLTSSDYHYYPTFDDWGNHIAGGWRTLTGAEWDYVTWYRTHASAKRGAATVCGVPGMVLLPDNFSGGTFTAGFDFYDFDYHSEGWSRNVYDASSWSEMEDAGAVFLPAAGHCFGIDYDMVVEAVGTGGCYWSSTPFLVDEAYAMCFDEHHVHNADCPLRFDGLSVRLVQEYHGN